MCKLLLPLLLVVGLPLAAQSNLGGLGGQNQSAQALEDRQEGASIRDALGAGIDWVVRTVRGEVLGQDAASEQWTTSDSPRAAVFTFVRGMHLQVYRGVDRADAIARTLPEGYDVDGPEVRALHQVFERLGSLETSDFPSKDSRLVEGISRFEVFPYAVDHEWVWRWIDEAPSGTVVLVKDASGRWHFDEATLSGASELLASLKAIPPTYVDAGDRAAQRYFFPEVGRTQWWAWLVAALGLALAIFSGHWLRRQLLAFGDRYEARTKPIVGSFFRSIATSLSVVAATLIFVCASLFIELSPVLSDLYWTTVQMIFLVALVWAFFGMTDLISTLVRYYVVGPDNEYGAMTVTILQRTIHSFLFVLIAIFILENLLGFSVGALVAGLGILGLALSLAGKETAQNLFGAVSIFINRPFVVGDWVCFKKEIGEVVDVHMQATHIKLLSGEMLIVPNMQFISNEVENLAMRRYVRREMDIAVPYATEPEKINQALKLLDEILRSDEIAAEGRCNLDENPPIISFSDYGSYYLNLKVYYYYFIGEHGQQMQRNSDRGWFTYLEHCTLVNQAILKAFNDHGIKFAFPTQTLALGRADEGTT